MEYRKIRMSRNMSLGMWVERVIYDMKFPSRLKPSSAYQVYVTLLHKLQSEGKLINEPVRAIGDRHIKSFIRWMQKSHSANYLGTMKTLMAALNRARKARLTRYVADFPYREFAPSSVTSDKAADFIVAGGSVASMTEEQWRAFLSLDLSRIVIKAGAHIAYWKELYRDFCILLYEMKSRPIDILKLHHDNIAKDPASGRLTCTYIPAKKKNQSVAKGRFSSALVVQFLSDEACRVVEKYRGKSGGGYVLPFAINSRRWNLNRAGQYHEHYRLSRNELWHINRFLHLVGNELGLPFTLTLYSIRRSAITHAIKENRIPLPLLAKMAGTSVAMIERHYNNLFHTLADY